MTRNCTDYYVQYIEYLQKSFTVEQTPYGCVIYTPNIGYNGDPITLYIFDVSENECVISDMGETLFNLDIYGINVGRGGYKEIFNNIISIYNVNESNNEISTKTSIENVGKCINSFISAIQAIQNLEFKKMPPKPIAFPKLVHQYYTANQIPHKYKSEITTKSRHFIDIMSMDGKTLIQAFGTSTETPSDIKRQTEIKLFPFLELKIEDRKEYKISLYDERVRWDRESIPLMESYSDEMVKWSQKDKIISALN